MFRDSDVEPLVLRQRGTSAQAGDRALLLHGLGSSESCWDPFVVHRPPALDLWTAGLPWRSGGPYAVAERAESTWIDTAIRQVPGGADVVIAHSYATILLLQLLSDLAVAGADPREELGIRALVLVSPFYRKQPKDFSWAELPGNLTAMRRSAEDHIELMSRNGLDPGVRADMAELACARLGPYWAVRYLDAYLRTPFLALDRIDLPVHLVVGDSDTVAPPAEAEALAGELGRASMERIAGCGHTPMAERPERFSLAVQQFLATLSAGHTPAAVN
ncbi:MULTISPECIES: alpha/beta fold hydrolase [unclassified Streptomyces]|uniref:alpha/beta fold hydrolase n=1 Tax=unclassified Streptomyces TaxID=2593676 RepID=UPI0009399DFE|nr:MULTISPECIES: alpha/beta hydrolase [unclassified Streptomyces]MBT2428890.1 alpha/beta hydrolase [Streptomyces sp. ISL-112]MBT2461306.1 alpha/beta hydrolase [Streptomyces sp. ISL-63]